MLNRFGLLLVLGLIASTSLSAQVTLTDTHEGGKPVPKPAPFNMKSAQVSRQAPLNNQAIIQMVKSGQQQGTILSTLRSRRGSFDLSPQGCAALRGANVSQGILNAMGDGSRSQCTSSLPSPGAVQSQHTLSGGTLLGNRNATLLGNHGAAVATPSNGGDPVSLNPQPFPPRTGKTLLGNSTAVSTNPSVTGATKTGSQSKLQPARASSVGLTQTKSAKGTPVAGGTSSAPGQ